MKTTLAAEVRPHESASLDETSVTRASSNKLEADWLLLRCLLVGGKEDTEV